MKVCVALAEATTAAVTARMAELAPWADLFEVRADHVRDLDLGALLRARTRPILFTCRSDAEGGRFPDRDASARRQLLREAVERGFDLVDVEARAGFDDVVEAKAGRGLVLSWHDTEGTPDDLDAVYDRMAAARPDVVKIAVTARSVRDLGRLLVLAARHSADEAPRLVAIAMGPLGVASRILGGRYNAPFGFAAAASGRGTAPGQLTAPVLVDSYRVRSIGRDTRVYGLLGSDVQRSLSPAIQNRAFAERGIDAVYVPLQAESMDAFRDALPALALSGWSVTRPYKGAILGQLDSVTAQAAEAGSANTVVAQDGRLVGLSTDGDGVLVPLRKRIDPAGRRVAPDRRQLGEHLFRIAVGQNRFQFPVHVVPHPDHDAGCAENPGCLLQQQLQRTCRLHARKFHAQVADRRKIDLRRCSGERCDTGKHHWFGFMVRTARLAEGRRQGVPRGDCNRWAPPRRRSDRRPRWKRSDQLFGNTHAQCH
jgi:3-dehydroquinate dehydratase type I